MTPELPDPVRLAVPAFAALVALEMWLVRRRGRGAYDWRDAGSSLALGLGSTAAGALSAGAVAAMAQLAWQHRLLDVPWSWWAFLLAFVLDDLAYYWFHRSAHRVRWFWASHVVHHSSQHYNLSTALRQTWTGFLSLSFLFRMPLFLIGFPPAMVFFCAGLNLVYQFWIHTEQVGRLPRLLEAVLNTPSHHRVHHATNPLYLDRNYGGVFIIWDRLFGTFQPELDAVRPRYGIVRQLGTLNPLWAAVHEWAGIARELVSARSLKEAAGILAGPPGWRTGETTEALRARDGAAAQAPAAGAAGAAAPAPAARAAGRGPGLA